MMKILSIYIFLMVFGLSAFCQEIDENGRTLVQKSNQKVISEAKPALEESVSLKSVFGTTLNFVLPEGKTAGEIVFIHANKDLILKTIPLSQNQGSIQLLSKDITEKSIIAALYVDGKLITYKNLKL